MMMAESTIAPMAMAMPPSDMMFEVRPKPNIGRNESRMAMGRVMIATSAERTCQRNTRHTSATTMLSSISFSRNVPMERLIGLAAVVCGNDFNSIRQRRFDFGEFPFDAINHVQGVFAIAHDDYPADHFRLHRSTRQTPRRKSGPR